MVSAPGVALIRVAAYPNDLNLPGWPDLASNEPEQWRTWLDTVWKLPWFAAAVTSAAPELAGQIARAVAQSSDRPAVAVSRRGSIQARRVAQQGPQRSARHRRTRKLPPRMTFKALWNVSLNPG